MAKATFTLEAGSCLQNGKYRILSVLGQGGFGITYLAEQTGLGMRVAIKEFFLKGSCQREVSTSMVSVPVTDNEELVHRCQKKFKSEARKIASLNNDHIVNIIDVFDENGTSYYVMKYLAGGSLASLVTHKGALSETDALKIIAEISDALKSIHSSGLLHLDIKPANILFDERGRAVLIDFGVSKYVDSEQDSSTTSSLIGFSRGFAPLEQVNSTISSLSAATDIYALGATLYNLVTGKTPPEAQVIMESGLPCMLPGISEEVKDAVKMAMLPCRTDRPQSVDAFLDLLPQEIMPLPEDDVNTVLDNVKGHEDEQPLVTSFSRNKIPFILSAVMLAASVVLAVITFTRRPVDNDPGKERTVQVVDEGASSKLNNLQSQLEDMKAQNDKLMKNNAALQKDIARLKEQVNEYKPDAERWQRHLIDLQKNKSSEQFSMF